MLIIDFKMYLYTFNFILLERISVHTFYKQNKHIEIKHANNSCYYRAEIYKAL